jgi:hypothetical protein
MFWILAYSGMAEKTDGFDKSNPYISRMTGETSVLPIG